MHSYNDDLLYKIALTQIPSVGGVTTRNLVSYCGGVEAVFRETRSNLQRIPGVGPLLADSIVAKNSLASAEAELDFIREHGIGVLFYLDDEFPVRLQRIKDAPALMYYKGTADLNTHQVISIVGTRKPSSYGKMQCEKLVDSLSSMDVLVISGLAYGIDITAHRKSLNVGLSTVGIMGSSFDHIYPAMHRNTANEMMQKGGILTEFGRGTLPDREHFPMRNRLIAGLCDALVVVESDIKGGSMITADLANGYHKDVFAIPGRVGDRYSKGCNYLIKSDRAHLLESGEELAEMMQWTANLPDKGIQRSIFQDLNDQELKLCEVLNCNEPVSIDKLYKEINLTASEMASLLLELEFKGVVKSLPGKLYLKV